MGGLRNYEAVNGAFPMAAIPNEDLPIGRRLSWIVEVQSFIEQFQLLIDRSKAWDDEDNMDVRWFGVRSAGDPPEQPKDFGAWKAILCPSNPDELWGANLGLTHYVGVTGIGEDAGALPTKDLRSGVFGFARRTRMQDITRAASATMTVIETAKENGPWTAAPAAVRHLEPGGTPYLGPTGQFNSHHPFGNSLIAWRESHGTNVVFVDGSVRTLTSDIEPKLFEAMATITANTTDWSDAPAARDGEMP
jgi:prepilin-type processing-associated H-X9-DG protein